MNKRGQIQELSTFLVALFVISVTMFAVWNIGDGMSDALRNSNLNSSDTVDAIDGVENIAKSGDTIFLAVFVFFFIILLISAVLLPTNIAFTALYLLGMLVMWILSVPLSNAYEKMSQTSSMAGAVADLTITDTIMLNLPIVASFIVALMVLILFGKRYVGVE